ncbi:hypothetical protein HAHE_16480 [Haloferula helveola]|uniref:Transmembrane protein n=1 Tax=Haloferula helveola TaxID=490095 RepID=A0ABM7R973_9BACT|nr:hypothetical protein HAHE_16480 [Haloferula helveola]
MDAGEPPIALKPWWRSIGFWLGAVVAVFFGWLWVDSEEFTTECAVTTDRAMLVVAIGDGRAALEGLAFGKGGGMAAPLWMWERKHTAGSRNSGNAIEHVTVRHWDLDSWSMDGMSGSSVAAPTWLLLVAWGAFWGLGWPWWRRRRSRRLAPATAGAE